MLAANDLEGRIKGLVPKVAADDARQTRALDAKDEAEAALLVRVLEEIKPTLPAICGRLAGDLWGFELIEGKPETLVRLDGTTVEDPKQLVRNSSLMRMLETIVKRLEMQSGREKAAEKADRRTAKVRAILDLLSN
jgi:hypothetical protein